MLRTLLRLTLVAAALTVPVLTTASTARAVSPCAVCNSFECRGHDHGHPDLFYNFYVPPSCGGVGAQMYLAPQPVPPHVGYTYYTYQPLMPHEMLYRHQRTYHRYYNEGRGMTRTSVRWW